MVRRRTLLALLGAVLVAGFVIAGALYALHLRRTNYHAAVETTVREHLGMWATVGSARSLGGEDHSLNDVHVFLEEGGEEVFQCREAVWSSVARAGSTDSARPATTGVRGHTLTIRDGWLLVAASGWTRTEYERLLAGGLGHDFGDLELSRVRLDNIDLRFRHPSSSLTAGGASGVAVFDDEGVGRASLACLRLNEAEVTEPVNITGRFTTGETLSIHEASLDVPKIALATLGLRDILKSGELTGSFQGTIRYRRSVDGEEVDARGSLHGAELCGLTGQVLGGPFHGMVNLDVESAVFRDGALSRLSGRGYVSGVRISELLPGAGASDQGRVELYVDDLLWAEGKLARLRAHGGCEKVSLETLSALLGPGRVTGDLSIDIRSVEALDDHLHAADVVIESTTPEDEPGTIDRDVLARAAEKWTGLNVGRLLPAQVEYTRLGARLVVEDDELRVFGTHGPEGRTVLTVNVLGRPWGIIKEPERTFDVPDVVALARARAETVKPKQAAAWWALRHLSDRYWDARMERYPTQATAIGDHRFNDRLADFSAAGYSRWRSTLEQIGAEVRALATSDLSEEDRLTRDLLERAIGDELLRAGCELELMPLEPLGGPHIEFPLLLVSQPFRHAKDFHDYIARLRTFSVQVDDLIANMRRGIQRRRVSPRVIIKKVVAQLRTHIVDEAGRSEFYKPAEKVDVIPGADRATVLGELTDAIDGHVIPAYRELLRFVEHEYLPACRVTVGIQSVPGGDRIYEALCRVNTTVAMSPNEIHEIGLAEVQRIRALMADVQREVEFDGSLDDFLAHMRTDPKYRFETGGELYAAADQILQRTKPLLAKLFGVRPKADCVMKEIEFFRAKSAPVAYYGPAPEDGSRPGYYYVNTYAPRQRLRFTLEALTYHESVPGHHFQIALDRENQRLPKFRRYGSFTAYVEGWALYSEKLGYEIGGYRDAYSRFGQLTFEMWRACRLVVDTGMHAKGWSRQEAIDFLSTHTSLASIDIEAEVDRYIAWPGQALAYKIGELRIVALRREAERRLGDAFDLRAFHDALLSGGAMPIDRLEERMRRWMAQ